MRMLSTLTLVLVACAMTDRSVTRFPATSRANPQPLFASTEPAPAGSALRVFVEPTRLVGWIAGSRSFAGQTATYRAKDTVASVEIKGDNTFVIPVRVANPTEATVEVDTLIQRVTVEPVVAHQPAAYFVVDRNAYRPGQKLAFTAFLRRLGEDGTFAPVTTSPVEVRIVSKTKQTIAARLALPVDATGRITGDYTFSPADPLDAYSVTIPGYRGAAEVTLAEYRKAKVSLSVDAKLAERAATLEFRATDFVEQPVAGGTVTFTAQVVQDGSQATPALDAGEFAYASPTHELGRDEQLLYKAQPETAGRLWNDARHVVGETTGEIALDARGIGTFRVPLDSAHLRGKHRLLVDATIVDANGREQRTTRSIPLARRDVTLQITTPHDLVASDSSIDVGVRAVDAGGRLVVPTSASIVALRIEPPPPAEPSGYHDPRWDFRWNDHFVNGVPNGGIQFQQPCTRAVCPPVRTWRPQVATQRADVLAATAAVVGDTASLAIPDPGAYRLIASAKLVDGSVVWGEAGIAVRERDALPELVLQLDRSELDHGDRVTGWLESKYRDARALVVLRDARGIRSRHGVIVKDGRTRLDVPVGDLGYGAAIDAYILGRDHRVVTAQELLHVAPTHRTLAIKTDAKASYAPGDTVDLGIEVDHGDPVDLVVSVFDQALLGIAPDKAVDPRNFFLADDRVRTRAALATLRARLGDVTVGSVLERARHDARRGNAKAELLVGLLGPGRVVAPAVAALLRYLDIPASGTGVDSKMAPAALDKLRVIDLLGSLEKLALVQVGDTIAIFDPQQAPQRQVAMPALGIGRGDASGNASYSVGNDGHMFQATAFVPAGPAPMGVGDATGVVRRDFSDSAFWSATTRTDASGRARLSFKLPDSLTNWQVVVTAVGRDLRVGRHTAKLRTVRDLMIWPLLPRQIVEGDTIEIGATVHNMTGEDRDVSVSLTAQNVDVLTAKSMTLRVRKSSSVPVTWTIRAGEPGNATLLASAVGVGMASADASLKRLPIVPSSAEQVVTASGFADRPLTIEVPAGIDPRRAKLELAFAPSLAADMARTLDYLVEYPYGCAEQTMSRFAPAIRVAGVLDNLGIRDNALVARLPNVVAGGLKRLAELQQPDGGWAWNGHAETHEMITPYVVWGLIQAENAGYKPANETTIQRGLKRVYSLLLARGDAQLSDRTYLMYVYSQRHRLSDAHWAWLMARSSQLSDYALGLALQMAVARKDTANAARMAQTLRDRAVRDSTGLHWRTGAFSRWMEDPFETTAVVLDALVAYDHTDPLLAQVIAYFVANKRGDRWNSTKDTAMILYAMTDYLRARGAGKTPASIDYSINEGPSRRLAFTTGLVREVTVDGTQLSRVTKIDFKNASPGVMVRAVLRYRATGRNLAASSNGLTVKRQLFLLGKGGARQHELRSGDRVPRGAYVESVVTVTHDGGDTMRYLLIEDPKPAGAEALPVDDRRFRLAGKARQWVLREDRETHLAFHHEQASPTTAVHTVLHLESAGDLVLAPASGELMYQTRTRGHSGSFALRVQ